MFKNHNSLLGPGVLFYGLVGTLMPVQILAQNVTNSQSSSPNMDMDKALVLKRFREQVSPHLDKDFMRDEFYLTRWLEAKEWKIDQAEAMLIQNLQWRKQNRMDSINEENWADMVREYPYEIDTFDKEGRPVGTLTVSKWDIRRAVSQGRVPRLQRYMYKMLEDLTDKLHETRLTNETVTQWAAILNADGFGLFQHACPSCISVWTSFVRSATDRYPGYAESISLINVPRALVRIVKPLFASESLKIYNNDRKAWLKYLDGKIDRKARRIEYGGTRE